MATEARVSQEGVLAITQALPKVRVSQVGLLVIAPSPKRLVPSYVVAFPDPRFYVEREVY